MAEDEQIEGASFLIFNRPICIGGTGIHESSDSFIKNLNGDYWLRILERYDMREEHEYDYPDLAMLVAALAQAQEQLLALIGAYFQANHCPQLWLYRYKTNELESVASAIDSGAGIPTTLPVPKWDWNSVAALIWPELPEDFHLWCGKILRLVARDFLGAREEYNCLKHGFRLNFGKTVLSIAPKEGSSNNPPSQDKFIRLIDPTHGCQYLSFKKYQGHKHVETADLRMASWSPHHFVQLLAFVAGLISNMGEAFRRNNFGIRELNYRLPPAEHINLCSVHRSVRNTVSLNFNYKLNENNIPSEAQIRSKYRFPAGSPSA